MQCVSLNDFLWAFRRARVTRERTREGARERTLAVVERVVETRVWTLTKVIAWSF
jgi:hypothetical protein